MLRINPPTALLLLEDHVALKPGEWVIQNVANSAVGRHLIVLAKAAAACARSMSCGATMSPPSCKSLGADVVLDDGDDLAARAHDAVGGAPIRLGIDAVSGTRASASPTAWRMAGWWSATARCRARTSS